MSFFSSLFGGGKKTDFGKIYAEPPKLKVDGADKFLSQLDSLIGDYESVRNGTNIFDAIKYIYEPQKAELDRLYGIGTQAGDTYGAKSGSLQQLQAGLNQRGLLDAGTSGLLESQVYADRNRQLADLFGQAKQTQRNEYFDSLTNLERLFPSRFEVANIPNSVNYLNDMNSYNVATQRNSATEGDRLMRSAQQAGTWASLFGNSIAGNMFQNNSNSLMNRASMFGGGGGPMISSGGGSFEGEGSGGFDFGSLFSNLFGGNSSPSPTPTRQSIYSGTNMNDFARRSSGVSSVFGPQNSAQASSLVTNSSPGMSSGNKIDFTKLLMQLATSGIA